MRFLMIGLGFLLAMAAPGQAQWIRDKPLPSYEQSSNDHCSSIEGLARTVMEARQRGVSMSQIMQLIQQTNPDAATLALARRMVTDAFNEPRYSTREYQQRAATDYGNTWAAVCYGLDA